MPACRNLRVYTAHKVTRTAGHLPCTFWGCQRTFDRLSLRTQHIRKCHSELPTNDYDRTDQPFPDAEANMHRGPLPHVDLLSSPRQMHLASDMVMFSPSISPMQDTPANSHLYPHSPVTPTSWAGTGKLQPFQFEWDEDDRRDNEPEPYEDQGGDRPMPSRPQPSPPNQGRNNSSDPDVEWDRHRSSSNEFEFEWDAEHHSRWSPCDDDGRPATGRSPSSSSSRGQASSPEPDAEWDERHGWGPYNNNSTNIEYDDDRPRAGGSQPNLPSQGRTSNPELAPGSRPPSPRSSQRVGDESVNCEYHEYINSKYIIKLKMNYIYIYFCD